VGKKKAAAAALNAHRAEEAAISEADQEEDDNYEDEGNVGSKKKKHNNNIKLKPKKSGGKKQHISAKGTLLWSAEKVLREEKKPMKASEIISKGREKGTHTLHQRSSFQSIMTHDTQPQPTLKQIRKGRPIRWWDVSAHR
jgi:hypothetical protein